jgi:hypothetical protein
MKKIIPHRFSGGSVKGRKGGATILPNAQSPNRKPKSVPENIKQALINNPIATMALTR